MNARPCGMEVQQGCSVDGRGSCAFVHAGRIERVAVEGEAAAGFDGVCRGDAVLIVGEDSRADSKGFMEWVVVQRGSTRGEPQPRDCVETAGTEAE